MLAATLTQLGILKLDDQPESSTVPESLQQLGKGERKKFLTNIAAKVVDQFVLQKKKLLRECYKQKKTWKKKSYRW